MRLKTIYTISVILTYTETFRREKSEAGTKVLASQLFLDFRARRSGGVGSTTLISSAFTALLNCGTTKSNSNELPISVPLSLGSFGSKTVWETVLA